MEVACTDSRADSKLRTAKSLANRQLWQQRLDLGECDDDNARYGETHFGVVEPLP